MAMVVRSETPSVPVTIVTGHGNEGIKLDIKEDRTVISSFLLEAGAAELSVPSKLSGPPLIIYFNPRYLMDLINVLEDEEVTLRLINSKDKL